MFAIIPARKGSKGLPGKNTKDFLGKPLIAHSIIAALNATSIDKVVVSTDSPLIRDISLQYGATDIGLRPESLALDHSQAIDTYIYTSDLLKKEFGYKEDRICILQPTSPLRLASDIDNAYTLFCNKQADSVISYTEEQHPISWHKYINADLSLEKIFQDTLENRQYYRQSVYPNGAIYIFKLTLLRQGKYLSDNTYCYLMPRNRSIDIDTIDDFEYAEYLAKKHE